MKSKNPLSPNLYESVLQKNKLVYTPLRKCCILNILRILPSSFSYNHVQKYVIHRSKIIRQLSWERKTCRDNIQHKALFQLNIKQNNNKHLWASQPTLKGLFCQFLLQSLFFWTLYWLDSQKPPRLIVLSSFMKQLLEMWVTFQINLYFPRKTPWWQEWASTLYPTLTT